MLKKDFPDINDWNALHRILCNVPSIQNSQDRRGLLRMCKVDETYINNLQIDNKAATPFVNDLISSFQREYENNLNPPIWGFINKKPVLAKFLENLIVSDSYVQSADDRAFITNLVERWRREFEAKLASYRTTYRQLLRTKPQPEIDRLSSELDAVKQELNLGQQIYQEIESKVEEDERKRKRNLTSVIVLVLTGLGICFFREPIWNTITKFISTVQRQLSSSLNSVNPTPEPTPTITSTSTITPIPTITPTTTPTSTITLTPTPIGYTQGWMFIGKLTRSSSGDDILDPPTVYPRMIPQSGAIVEVIETINIRSDQPQAPDFDYAQQEILGCVVPGEKVEILQVEIVPNQAVWAKVQITGGNPTFSPRCPSNGIRAWW